MRCKKPAISDMLDALEAEAAIARASDNPVGHLSYIHMLVHELEDSLYRHRSKQGKKENTSAIEYVFRKLEYE